MKSIFTVDVEGHVGSDPVEHLIYGKTIDGKLCGIDLIMDILDEFNIRGLFFVDIAEAWDYGEEKIAGVMKHIAERGHDVGVHIHPDHMADKKRLFLSEYNREEQFEIIKKCTDFYEKTLGYKPVAFRAGKYGANRITLDILVELGYKVDFSQYYGQKWCHIDPPVAKVNVRVLDNGLLEIPVTSYVSLDVGFYSRHDKIDCGQSYSEYKTIMKKLLNNHNDVAVLFAHSFSLLRWRRTPNSPRYRKKLMTRLKRQLEYVNNFPGISVISIEEAVKIYKDRLPDGGKFEKDIITNGIKPFYWFAGRAITVIKSKIDIRFRSLK